MRSLTLATLVGLLMALPATAALVVDLEANNTFATAQILAPGNFTLDGDPTIGLGSVGGGFLDTSGVLPHVTITSAGDPGASLDFFRFTATGTGTVILDIDSAPQVTTFDTTIHLFDAAGTPLATSDDTNDDPGDLPGVIGGAFNSRIETALGAGDYVVAVSRFFSEAMPGGVVTNMIGVGGAYTLHVSAEAQATAVPAPAPAMLLGLGLLLLPVLWRGVLG